MINPHYWGNDACSTPIGDADDCYPKNFEKCHNDSGVSTANVSHPLAALY